MTIYNTTRGTTYDPMPVELWHYDGTGPIGRLETAEKLEFTWADRTTGTAVIETPLTDMSRHLLKTDGSVLVVASFNGKRHVSTVVEAEVFSEETGDVRVKATCASPWSILEGQRIGPAGAVDTGLQSSAEFYQISGPVETVVKNLVTVGAWRLGHPIKVMPDRKQGPSVSVSARWETTAELVEGALAGTGYRLSLETWLPGDGPVGDLSLTAPAVVADVVPYRPQEGLIWSSEAGDLDKWELVYKRSPYTTLMVGDSGEGTSQKYAYWGISSLPVSPWGNRESYVQAAQGEDIRTRAITELKKCDPSVSANATATPSQSWEFGSDGLHPRQFDVGDWVTLDLGEVGTIRQVITSVTVTLTPLSLTITPTVGTPDTGEQDLYSMITGLSRRLDRTIRR